MNYGVFQFLKNAMLKHKQKNVFNNYETIKNLQG